jgi:transcriptional regulator with XRE-family HTH domain
MSQQRKNIDLLEAIAARLKALRAERGLSQETVFYDTEIHIARIETAKANISVSTLHDLCCYYQITLQEFFAQGFAHVQKEV